MKKECGKVNRLLCMKKKRCKVLLQTLDIAFDAYPNNRNFIKKFLTKICRNENLPDDQVFSVNFGLIYCCLSFLELVAFLLKKPCYNLWIVMHDYEKAKKLK